MKKFLKRILCVFVVAVMAFSPISSFAFELDGDEYIYAGELTEGQNYFFSNVWDEDFIDINFYCSFTAENDGYYGFDYGHMHSYVEGDVYSKDSPDAKVEYEYTFYDEEYYSETRLYYLAAGEYYFAGFSNYPDDMTIFFDSLGESMTAVSFDHELMYGYDFFESEDGGNYVYTETRTDIVFSSGESFTIGSPSLNGRLESEFKEGENNATFEFLGKSLPSVMSVYKIDYFISDVEINSVEKYLDSVVEYYNGYDYIYPQGEIATVTFTDGTTNSFDINPGLYGDYVLFPNGEHYYCDIYFDFYGLNNVDLVISFDEAEVKRYEHKIKRASVAENAKLFTENSKIYVENSEEHFDYAVENFDWKNISGTAKSSFEYMILALLDLFMIQIEIYDFVFFYLGIPY